MDNNYVVKLTPKAFDELCERSDGMSDELTAAIIQASGVYIDTDDVELVLADWIDPHAIAKLVCSDILEAGVSLTLERAQQVWLDVLLTELPDAIQASTEALQEKGAFDA